MFDIYLKQVFLIVLCVSAVPLCISSVSGLIVAVLQAATQIQDQTIAYFVKFLSLAGVIYFFSGWFASEMVLFTRQILQSIEQLGGM